MKAHQNSEPLSRNCNNMLSFVSLVGLDIVYRQGSSFNHYEKIFYLCVLVHLGIGIVRNCRRIKEVEEAVGLDLLGDRPHAPLALVLLLLLHLLHRQVLPLLPVNGTASALEDLRALQRQFQC